MAENCSHRMVPISSPVINALSLSQCELAVSHQSNGARKLKAAQCLLGSDDVGATFHMSEGLAAALRTMAVYRQEQITGNTGHKMHKITNYLKPIEEIMREGSDVELSDVGKSTYRFLQDGIKEMEDVLKDYAVPEEPLHRRYLRFSEENNVDNFLKILGELPEEWTVIQLTAPYNPMENIKPRDVFRAEIDSIYVGILRNEYLDVGDCGPFTLRLPENVTREGERRLFVELYSLLEANLQTIENAGRAYTHRTIRTYWDKREDTDLRMMSVIDVMDKQWLGGWKCLLTGKLKDKGLRDRMNDLVERTCVDWGFIRVTSKQRILLCNLLESSHHISSAEIRITLRKILSEYSNIVEAKSIAADANFPKCHICDRHFDYTNELCVKCQAAIFERMHHFSLVDAIKAFMEVARQVKNDSDWAVLKAAKRHPVILIVDEMLDTFPWEYLPVLSHRAVSRMESLHFLYSLFKTHESHIREGCFVMRPENGRYLINPDNNLDRMEKRMSCFVSYWCPEWLGERNRPPQPDQYLQYLKESDLFLYCGHGDGFQYACGGAEGAGVEAAAGAGEAGAGGMRAAALLSGCGSVRLQHAGGRVPPLASHYHYHIAGSPMVIGMLWEVTDLEVDKVVTTMLSLVVPSKAPVPWESVGKSQWSQGTLDLNVESTAKVSAEQDLLSAIAKARRATKFVMIASSVVARGLPVRVEPAELPS